MRSILCSVACLTVFGLALPGKWETRRTRTDHRYSPYSNTKTNLDTGPNADTDPKSGNYAINVNGYSSVSEPPPNLLPLHIYTGYLAAQNFGLGGKSLLQPTPDAHGGGYGG